MHQAEYIKARLQIIWKQEKNKTNNNEAEQPKDTTKNKNQQIKKALKEHDDVPTVILRSIKLRKQPQAGRYLTY